MTIASNQKVGELARIAYLVLLHAESELWEDTNTLDGAKFFGEITNHPFNNIGYVQKYR